MPECAILGHVVKQCRADIFAAKASAPQEFIGEESIFCGRRSGTEIGIRECKCPAVRFGAVWPHALEFVEALSVRRNELQSFHLRPTVGPRFALWNKQVPPMSAPGVSPTLKASIHRRRCGDEAKCLPSRNHAIRTQ